jgi:hypothetical protein
MRPGVRTICDVGFMVRISRQSLEDAIQHPAAVPAGEARVDCLPRAEALGQVPPWRSRLRDVEDRVQEVPVREQCRPPWASPLGRKKRPQPRPLCVAQLMSMPHLMPRSKKITWGNFLTARSAAEFGDST